MNTEIEQNLRADAIFAEPPGHALLTTLAFAEQHIGNDGRRRIADQHHDATPLFGDNTHGFFQHLRAWPGCPQNIVEDIDCMNAHEHGFRPRNVTFHQRNMLRIFHCVQIDHQLELTAEIAVEFGFDRTMNEIIVAAAIGNQVRDSRDLQSVKLCKLHEVRQPCHRPVVVHDLADDAGRIKPGEPRDVDRRFRVPGPNEHAAIARYKRKHVPGRDDVCRSLGRIYCN